MSRPEGVVQGEFIDNSAASGVDEHYASFHPGQSFGIHEMPRLGVARKVDAQKVGLSQHGV